MIWMQLRERSEAKRVASPSYFSCNEEKKEEVKTNLHALTTAPGAGSRTGTGITEPSAPAAGLGLAVVTETRRDKIVKKRIGNFIFASGFERGRLGFVGLERNKGV